MEQDHLFTREQAHIFTREQAPLFFIYYQYIMAQTLINLTKAFVGESQARNRYSMYASAARKE